MQTNQPYYPMQDRTENYTFRETYKPKVKESTYIYVMQTINDKNNYLLQNVQIINDKNKALELSKKNADVKILVYLLNNEDIYVYDFKFYLNGDLLSDMK
jgi:hypothetical protein